MIEPNPALLDRIENTIRFLAVDAIERAGIGHVGAPMALAAAAFELWDNHLRFDPKDPTGSLRDRFVLSNGHASMLSYSLLHLFGFDLSLEDLAKFRQLGSRTPGHPEYGETRRRRADDRSARPGLRPRRRHGARRAHDARSGARIRRADGRGRPTVTHFVYGFVGDGDLMEGVAAEAASLAGHLALGNLIYLYDDNSITIDGATQLTFTRGRAEALHAPTAGTSQTRSTATTATRSRRRSTPRAARSTRPSLIVAQDA